MRYSRDGRYKRNPLQQSAHAYLYVHISVAKAFTNGYVFVALLGVARLQCNTYTRVGNKWDNRCKIATECKQQTVSVGSDIDMY